MAAMLGAVWDAKQALARFITHLLRTTRVSIARRVSKGILADLAPVCAVLPRHYVADIGFPAIACSGRLPHRSTFADADDGSRPLAHLARPNPTTGIR